MARVYQKDLTNTKASKKATQAWWIEILDCDGNRIVEKIGNRAVAIKILNQLQVKRDQNQLFKKNGEKTIGDDIDRYEKAKIATVANPVAFKSSMNYQRKLFGQYKRTEFPIYVFKKIRSKLVSS
jgi:hypothetical protein